MRRNKRAQVENKAETKAEPEIRVTREEPLNERGEETDRKPDETI